MHHPTKASSRKNKIPTQTCSSNRVVSTSAVAAPFVVPLSSTWWDADVSGEGVGAPMTTTRFEISIEPPLVGNSSIKLTFDAIADPVLIASTVTVTVSLDGVIVASTFTEPALRSTLTCLLSTPGFASAMPSATFAFNSLDFCLLKELKSTFRMMNSTFTSGACVGKGVGEALLEVGLADVNNAVGNEVGAGAKNEVGAGAKVTVTSLEAELAVVGASVGVWVCVEVELAIVGASVAGAFVVGTTVGSSVETPCVGAAVGDTLTAAVVGTAVGTTVGTAVGTRVGITLGITVGAVVGVTPGTKFSG